MGQAFVLVSLALTAHAINYRLLPRKSHSHKVALGSTVHLPLAGPAQEMLLSGPGMLRVEAVRKDARPVRVYVREAGVVDEVISLADAASGEALVTLPPGPQTVEIVADADAPGTIAVTFASHLTPKLVARDAAVPVTAAAAPAPVLVSPVGAHPMAALDSGDAVYVVKPGRPLRLRLAPRVSGVHLMIWRALASPQTRILVHGDGHILMSAVLASSTGSEHLNGDTALAVPEDLFIEPDPGTHQLLLTADDVIGVALGK